MSRVDDDREAARVAARLAEQRRVEADQRSKKATENAQFARLVGEQKVVAQQKQERSAAHSAIAQLLEATELHEGEGVRQGGEREEARGKDASAQVARGALGALEKGQGQVRSEADRTVARQGAEDRQTQELGAGNRAAESQGARVAELHRGDARAGREALEERKAESEAATEHRATTGRGTKELKTDADGGGGQQQGSGGRDPSKEGGGAMAQSLRFNPALMAPPPVAQQKATAGSERLRKVANELAQKIVERVRVGTNALGRAEFQIDLRQDVLAGLSVKVSAHNGKINAVFSGSDREVLKLVEQHAEALKSALAGRGLTLEGFKIEART